MRERIRPRGERFTGFTLIELLIVIAIIAILAAILFPVFAQAREKARQTACLSNMKQMGIAVGMYETDYDEMTPNGYQTSGGGNGWAGQVYPYVKSAGAYICPSDTTASPICSYAINANLAPHIATPYSSTGILLSQMVAPSKTVLFCEVINSGVGQPYTIANEQITRQHDSPSCTGSGSAYDPLGAGGALDDTQIVAAATAGTPHLQYATGYLRLLSGSGGRNPTTVALPRFTGPDGRHQQGAVYLMADNHAKWLLPSQVGGGYANDGSGSQPCGWAPYGMAPSTKCSDTTIAATFSYQ
jgi:prepilin-type N-terminal cleavage/methylation domain-containing protein